MSEELYFNDELRKCLNAAGLSDCGENDTWNYWYHRVHKAHDQTVDRVTEAQRAENAKLRKDIDRFVQAIEDLHDVNLEDKLVQLENENDKLRKQANFEHFQLGEMKKAASMMLDEFVALETDNVKLKELVANYSAATKYLCGHSHCNECNLDCASVFGDVPSGWDCARMLLDKRARELGVKVNYK